MSKELEILKNRNEKLKLNHFIGNRKIADEEIKDITIAIDDVIKELEKALTPPTKEEICKALSDFLKREVVFEDGCFLYHWNFNGVAGLACIVKYDYWLGFVIFYEWNLPPHIITMIGRFYESQGDNNVNNAED